MDASSAGPTAKSGDQSRSDHIVKEALGLWHQLGRAVSRGIFGQRQLRLKICESRQYYVSCTASTNPAVVDQRIVQEAQFNIRVFGPSSFLAFIQAAAKYLNQVYRPQIELWITAADRFAASRAQERVDSFMANNSDEAR